MNTHVILIHGFNVRDAGAGSVGKLAPYLAQLGCTTEVFDYGYFNLFAPRWRNRGVAKRLTERVAEIKEMRPQCVVIGHSNGATVTHIAGEEFGAEIDKVVYINPALDRHVRFPVTFGSFDVWHNPHDKIVSLARFLPFHPWGDMGRTGFTRFDPRGRNYNIVNFASGKGGAHSKKFSDETIQVLGPLIAEKAILGGGAACEL